MLLLGIQFVILPIGQEAEAEVAVDLLSSPPWLGTWGDAELCLGSLLCAVDKWTLLSGASSSDSLHAVPETSHGGVVLHREAQQNPGDMVRTHSRWPLIPSPVTTVRTAV